MIIQIQHCGFIFTVETPNEDLTTDEMFDIFTGLLIQLGYQNESIKEVIESYQFVQFGIKPSVYKYWQKVKQEINKL